MALSKNEMKGRRFEFCSLVILQLLVSLLLLSRGWLTWRWDSPIRDLIWEEKWWSPVLAKYDVTWSHFARTSDLWITPGLERMGIFLIATALILWLAGVSRLRWLRWILVPASLILVLDAFSRWVGKDMQTGILMEYALSTVAPIALLIYLGRGSSLSIVRGRIVTWLLLIATALTFAGHGLYAMGHYSVPLDFRMMTTEILPVTEEGSLTFLKIAGWLDFVVVGLLFIPMTRSVALVYMLCWGGATSLARILTYYEPDLPWNGMDPWLAEALVRTPHWLVPLWLLLQLRRSKKETHTEAPGGEELEPLS